MALLVRRTLAATTAVARVSSDDGSRRPSPPWSATAPPTSPYEGCCAWAAAAAHERCASGEPAELDISDRLRGRISSVTLKRGLQTGAEASPAPAARP